LLALAMAGVMLPGFVGVAVVANAHAVPPPSWLLTRFDAAIPFVPAAVWPYVSWYPSSFLLLLAPRAQFRRLCFAEFTAYLICSVGHLLWPVFIVRPVLDGLDGPSVTVLRALYALDPPVSLFPSFHAAVPPILLQLRPPSRALRVGLVLWMIAICVSCILTKQHYVLDVIAGLAVGFGAVAIADVLLGLVTGPSDALVLEHRRGHESLVATHAVDDHSPGIQENI
jgi:hypothetical protein